MKGTSRTKHISEVNLDEKEISIRKPLKLSRDNQRRFIRLQISSPMSLQTVKDIFGQFHPAGDYDINGEILNISAGGVLAELEQPVNEGDIVAMRFSLETVEPLEGVLGVVKRCDHDEEGNLVGVEFINRQWLTDKLSQAEMQLLSESYTHFDQSVKNVLSAYISETKAP